MRERESRQRIVTEWDWLGAETRPGDLADINRVYQAWQDAAARNERSGDVVRPLGLVAIAMRWSKRSPSRLN
jgi:hypothetical protein